jgi:hypothetical protein
MDQGAWSKVAEVEQANCASSQFRFLQLRVCHPCAPAQLGACA